LKTEGVYAIVRHPMYLLTILAFVLTPVMSLDRFCFMVYTIMYITIVTQFEEAYLIEKYGEKYNKYQEEVPSLFPINWIDVRRPMVFEGTETKVKGS